MENKYLLNICMIAAVIALAGCSKASKVSEAAQSSTETVAESTEVIEIKSEDSAPRVEETIQTVSTNEQLTPCDDTVYVTGDNVNIRKSPDKSSEVVKVASKASEYKRTAAGDSWSEIKLDDGSKAYISADYISTKKPEVRAAASGDSISLNPSWTYASFSKINSGTATMYRATENRKGIVVCVNAGHGTSGGSSVKTQCHPDGSAKVTSGSTAAGATMATAVSDGMTFADGTPESKVTLAMAKALKSVLLSRGYDVLMIRESDDVQLDNIARTVIANNMANCHIALHWDSTDSNKGAFYMSVPEGSYRSMEPVASHWQQHEALGSSLVEGLRGAGVKIFSSGSMDMDLTQTSYSTVPSVDIELGDKVSDHSEATLATLAKGLADGVDSFFK